MASLSLLSRGNAQVVKTTQERLEVHYEPEDYFNWKSHHDFHLRRLLTGKYASHYWEIPRHKTYSTKKGPLVLYSEDLALPVWNASQDRHGHRSYRYKRKNFQLQLSTLLDLSGAILAYGRKQSGHADSHWQPYLHFLNEEDVQYDRQIRPGYSPKRYLTRLFQTWDPSTLYKLQQAGSLRDSVQLQQLTSHSGEASGRHPDLSSTPVKYQRLPVFAHLPQWTNADTYTGPGRCTPVEEEPGNEEKLGDEIEISQLLGKKPSGPISSCGTLRKPVSEHSRSHVSQGSWKPREQMSGEIQPSLFSGDDNVSNQTHGSEKLPTTLEVPILKDNASVAHGKPHTTFYGGPFTGRKKYPYSKQELMRLQNESMENLAEGSFLPPISQSAGQEPDLHRDNKIQESIKLPPIMEDSSRVPQRKRRRRAADPPKELLIIPLLVHFENEKATQAEKTPSMDRNIKAESKSHNEVTEVTSNKLQSQEDLTLDKEIPTTEAQNKVKTLQMDIDWNLDPNTDGDSPGTDALPLGLLPPLNGKKGPGNQSSMANLKAPNSNNTNASSKSQSLPTGIIRGSIPEELKECCKGGSVGSLIMSPNGEIVCLSVMGAARETDMPIRFDFIPEEEEDEDCLPEESAGQKEQGSASQEEQEQEMGHSDSPRQQNVLHVPERPTSGPDRKHQKVNIKIPVPEAIMQEEADNVSDQQIDNENIHKRTMAESGVRNQEMAEQQNDRRMEASEARKEAGDKEPGSTELTKGSWTSRETLSTEDTNTATGEEDAQNAEGTNKAPHLLQISQPASQPSHRGFSIVQQDASSLEIPEASTEAVRENIPSRQDTKIIKNTETNTAETLHTKPGDTHTGHPLQKLSPSNANLSSETANKREEKMPKNRSLAPPAAQNEHSKKRDATNKGKETQPGPIQKDPDISKKKTSVVKKPEINAEDGNKSNESKVKPQEVKPYNLPSEAEATQQGSQPRNPKTAEDEEMALLQEIAKTSKSETTKGKKKNKPEKVKNTEKSQAKAVKKPKQGSATEGREIFVVGPPRKKKTESKISYPKKPPERLPSQQDTGVTQEMPHEKPEEEEEDTKSEKGSEDSYKVFRHEERSPTPPPRDLPPGPGKEITDDSTKSTLLVANQTNDIEIANSETSESTIGSFRQRRSSRVRDLSEKAERRRLEVEKKRREREEQLRLEKEQQDRMERMRLELEEEQRKRTEEIRLRKIQEEEERQRQEQEKARRMQLEQQALERARQQQEEYRRKLQEIQRRKQQEELERIEQERQRKQEQERLEAEERMRLLEMAAEEREEYLRKKREREEQARLEEEERRLRAEAEAKAIMEEAQRQAQLLARRTAALEQQLQFNRGLMKESIGMEQTQGVSRPWVFSYYEFLELLGLPLPVEGE